MGVGVSGVGQRDWEGWSHRYGLFEGDVIETGSWQFCCWNRRYQTPNSIMAVSGLWIRPKTPHPEQLPYSNQYSLASTDQRGKKWFHWSSYFWEDKICVSDQWNRKVSTQSVDIHSRVHSKSIACIELHLSSHKRNNRFSTTISYSHDPLTLVELLPCNTLKFRNGYTWKYTTTICFTHAGYIFLEIAETVFVHDGGANCSYRIRVSHLD